ncbi:MAG: alpha/beta fold hydrolase [Thermofilum sp.]
MMQLIFTVVAAIAALLILLLVILSASASRRLAQPPRHTEKWTPKDLGYDYEDVEVKTEDGLVLRGWLVKRDSDRTVIAVHGYTSSRWSDYMRMVLDILARNGFNVAVFDMRAHGASEGAYTTLGYREVRDISAIVDWLESRGLGGKLGIIGYSMGGAITLMALSAEPRLRAGVADSPYIDIRSSGRNWIKLVKAPLRYLLLASYPLVVRLTARKTGVNPENLVMYNYAQKIKKPLLIIAGRNDELVPLEEVEKFYQLLRSVNPNAEIWVNDARHVAAIKDYTSEYEKRVVSFFSRWLQ